LWSSTPLILASLVACKMTAAAFVAIRLDRSGLLSDRILITGALTWGIVVLGLYRVFVWLFAMPVFPSFVLGLFAILLVPLARLSAAPLALSWNRHR
jgi:hypothetical protein